MNLITDNYLVHTYRKAILVKDNDTIKMRTLALFCLFGSAFADFYSDHDAALAAEDSMFLGAEIILNGLEVVFNDQLMSYKEAELDQAYVDAQYPPSQHFFQRKADMEQSQVFQALKPMPKGAAIHTFDTGLTSIDWVIANLTYEYDNVLYFCDQPSRDPPELRFAAFATPSGALTVACDTAWVNVANFRASNGAAVTDAFFKQAMVMTTDDPYNVYPDQNVLWPNFTERFYVVESILNYEPAPRAYLRRAFEEFLADEVYYMEVCTSLYLTVCRNNGFAESCNAYDKVELAGIYQEEVNNFMAAHPLDTCGVKFIHSASRQKDHAAMDAHISLTEQLMATYPNLFIGMGLTTREDTGNPPIYYADQLINASQNNPQLAYYIQAGETSWQGQPSDLAVIDAILLGSKRISHGMAVVDHPESKRLVLENDVAIEVCPVSNQVLGFVKDLRMHPASSLIQEGYPMVVSSDDPAIWEASGLTYDFYETFMALASYQMDLRLLKKLVFNSVDYSGLNPIDKGNCRDLVQGKWDNFMLGLK